ncbi:MAG: histidine kinase [Bacteroidota bacterium]
MPDVPPTPPLPPPRLSARGLAIAAGLGVLYAVASGLVVAQLDGSNGFYDAPYPVAIVGALVEYALVGVLMLGAWALVIRGLDGAGWGWKLAAHLVLAPVFAVAWYALYALVVGAMTGENLLDIADIFVDGRWGLFSKLTEYVLIVAVLHTVREVNRLRAREAQARDLAALAQERELAALKAQLNPHFLFNALNSINAALAGRREDARSMVVGLGDLLRYALAASERAEVPLAEEVAAAEAYLAIEQHRFADRLRVEVAVAPDALAVPVPPLVVQPLLENAVRHGLAPTERGGTVRLTARRDGGHLRITVEDNGTGASDLDPAALLDAGVGLRNTDRRLRTRYGEAAGLQIDAPSDGGFRVRFAIPAPVAESPPILEPAEASV